MRRAATILMALAMATTAGAANGLYCPFCSSMGGKTLVEDVGEASLVLHGTLANAKPGDPEGSTDFVVQTVIKDHSIIEGKKTVVLPRYIPLPDKKNQEFIAFVAVIDNKLDLYRLIQVDEQGYLDYLLGAMKSTKLSAPQRLAFYFNFLESKISDVSTDAYKEFSAAPFADVKAAAKNYDPDKLLAWIQAKDTQGYKLGLYGCLMGVCGRPQDALALKKLLTGPADRRPLTGVDGIMGGYCMLDPKDGVPFVLQSLSDEKLDFNFRYAALRTVRFILQDMPQVDKKTVFDGMAKAITTPDIADLVIDEFRQHKIWTPAETVLSLYDKPDYSLSVVKRAIIRFALKCPDPKATEFIAKLRKTDPVLVGDVEEILRFEEMQRQQPAPAAKPSP